MLKKLFLGLFLGLFVFAIQISAFAYAHKLTRNWYNENVAGVKKEDVTSITIEDCGYDKSALKVYWEIDKNGLIAYLDGESDVVISIPEGNTLETGVDASGLFSFFIFNDPPDYETGDDGVEIKGLDPPDEGYQVSTYKKYISNLESINNLYLLNTYSTERFNDMFMGLNKLTKIDLSSMKTMAATSFENMFAGCEELKYVDLSSFDTSNVTTMSGMFRDCKNLQVVNTKGLKTSQLCDVSRMFENCKNLFTINLNHLDFSSVTDMSSMFDSCEKLESVLMEKLDTKDVRNTESMFNECVNLKTLNFGNFNSKSVNNCSFMFWGCKSLETLDLSSFKLTGNVYMDYMLANMNNLKTIKLSDSLCERIKKTRLGGDWKNTQNNKVYSLAWDSKDVFVAGEYVKQT